MLIIKKENKLLYRSSANRISTNKTCYIKKQVIQQPKIQWNFHCQQNFYQVDKLEALYYIYNDKIVFEIEGTYDMYYSTLPTTITADTLDTATMELSLDLFKCDALWCSK